VKANRKGTEMKPGKAQSKTEPQRPCAREDSVGNIF
jgi:hypothetical protein